MTPSRSDTRNEDWLRTRCWDIWIGFTLVSTLPQLQQYLRHQQLSLDHFLSLPAAEAMPESLREEVELFRQERMAQQMTEKVADPPPGVVDQLAEVLERKDFVRTQRGVEKYDQPLDTLIVPDLPNLKVPRTSRLLDAPADTDADTATAAFTPRRSVLYNEREARLLTDADYAAKFEKNLAFLDAPLPEDVRPADPKTSNPLYAAYVADLNRRLAHALVEPGPFGVVQFKNMKKIDKKTGKPGKLDWMPTPDGQELLDGIVDDELDRADARGVPRERLVLAAAGVSGAGKTTVLKAQAEALGVTYGRDPVTGQVEPQNYLVSNPDDLKDRMKPFLHPEYAALGINPDETAALTHELSSIANKTMIVRATRGDPEVGRAGGYNILLDATYEGPMDKREGEYRAFTEAGYEVSGILVDGDVATSLNRATGRHTSVQKLLRSRLWEEFPDDSREEIDNKVRTVMKDLDLAKPGVLDSFGIPPNGYDGRYVPVVLVGEQIAHGPYPLDENGEEMLNAPWDDQLWKSRNAMNFYEAIKAGWFGGRWRVVDSHQKPIEEGDQFHTLRDQVNSLSTSGTKAATIVPSDGGSNAMRDDISATIPEPVDILRSVYLAPNPPGTFRFLEMVVDYNLNRITFDQLAAWVQAWENVPALGLVDLGFHGSEDAYPQPGTGHELLVARSVRALTRDEYRTLDGLFAQRANPRPDSP